METLQLHSTFVREVLFCIMCECICLFICLLAGLLACSLAHSCIRAFVRLFIQLFVYRLIHIRCILRRKSTPSQTKFWQKRALKYISCRNVNTKFDKVTLYHVDLQLNVSLIYVCICEMSMSGKQVNLVENLQKLRQKCVEVCVGPLKIYIGKVHLNAYSLWLKFCTQHWFVKHHEHNTQFYTY